MSHLRILTLIPTFSLSIIAVIGCGTKNPLAPASVSGGVSYQGKTLTGGTVQFFTSGGNGTPYSSQISVDGTYSVADLPTGEMAVVVETESVNPVHKDSSGKDAERRNSMMDQRKGPNGQGGSASSGPEPKYIKIPDKYSKAKTSPLTYTVKNGRQVYNIELD
jgi:hypothetical protein